jgi:hypothetical protein
VLKDYEKEKIVIKVGEEEMEMEENRRHFSWLDAVIVIGSIVTLIADQVTGLYLL